MILGLLRFRAQEAAISWRQEVWPFQWRIAVSWACSYFIFQLFNPVLFAYRGPIEAGRMGMSLNIANSISALALAWITTKAAPFGSMVARNQIAALDQLFRKTVWQSSIMLTSEIVVVLAGLAVLENIRPALANRILPFGDFALLLLTVLLGHVVVGQAYYLRAHKQEPFLYFWVLIAVLSVVGIVWGAKIAGVEGVLLANFVCAGVGRLAAGTYVFNKKRREWHGPASFQNRSHDQAA